MPLDFLGALRVLRELLCQLLAEDVCFNVLNDVRHRWSDLA